MALQSLWTASMWPEIVVVELTKRMVAVFILYV